jgi:hypothetical protein
MGTYRRSVFGLLGMASLVWGCGETGRDGDAACKTCSSTAGGGSSGTGGASGPAGGSSATTGHSGAGTSPGGTAAGQGGGTAGSDGGSAGDESSAGTGGNGGEGAASASTPERIVAVTYLLNLIVKDGYVFYSDAEDNDQEFSSGHLRGVSVTGGTPRIYAQAPSVPEGTASSRIIYGIASDGSNLYWSEVGETASHVAKTSIDTGETVDVWSDSSCGIRKPLALAGTQLYWLATCVGVSGQLMTASTAGGSASVVASGNDPGWLPNPSGSDAETRGLAIGNEFAVWTQVTGAVVSLPLSGGETPLRIEPVTQVNGPSAIAMVGDRAFFLQSDYKHQARGDIWSIVPDTDFATAATSLLHISQQQLIEYQTSLTVDEDFVYWGVTDSIKRAPLGGGEAVVIVSAVPHPDPRALAVDDTHIYWADDTGIWRAPKPGR